MKRFFTTSARVTDVAGQPVSAVAVGDAVRCKTMFGETMAKVTEVGLENSSWQATAETTGLVLPLFVENGFWCCNHAITKQGLEELGRMRTGL